MRIAVTGGRYFRQEATVFKALDIINPSLVVQGGCTSGVDKYVRTWASERGIKCVTAHAAWEAHGKSAGPIRNAWMFEIFPYLHALLTFPGGRGTASAIREAQKHDVTIMDYAVILEE